MTNKEKSYHLANIIVITLTVLSGILLARMGQMADTQQISMGAPGIMMLSALLFVILGGGVIWIVISTLLNKNIRGMLTKVNLKSSIVIIGLLIIMIAFSIFIFPLAIVFAILAIYLFVTSGKKLITKDFEAVSNQ